MLKKLLLASVSFLLLSHLFLLFQFKICLFCSAVIRPSPKLKKFVSCVETPIISIETCILRKLVIPVFLTPQCEKCSSCVRAPYAKMSGHKILASEVRSFQDYVRFRWFQFEVLFSASLMTQRERKIYCKLANLLASAD